MENRFEFNMAYHWHAALTLELIALISVFLDPGVNQFVCLDSDDEDGFERESWKNSDRMDSDFDVSKDLDQSTFIRSTSTIFGKLILHVH